MYIVYDFLTTTLTVINPLFFNTSGILGWGGGCYGGGGVIG